MDEEAFVSALGALGLDAHQVQVAKSKVPTARYLHMIFGEDNPEWTDEQIEACISEGRKTIYDEYRQNGEEWDSYIDSQGNF